MKTGGLIPILRFPSRMIYSVLPLKFHSDFITFASRMFALNPGLNYRTKLGTNFGYTKENYYNDQYYFGRNNSGSMKRDRGIGHRKINI
jgi:hypothetical protein